MQLTAKLVQVLPAQTGQGKNGEWKKQDIVVETDGQYPKKVCVSVWGDKLNHLKLEPGEVLTIDFDVESREYNGKWYTDVKAWRVASAEAGGAGAGSGSNSAPAAYRNNNFPDAPPASMNSFDEDLPF